MKRLLYLKGFLVCAVLCYSFVCSAQHESASFSSVWFEEAIDNGQMGLKAHATFDISGMKGKEFTAGLRFFDDKINDWYGTKKSPYCYGYDYPISVDIRFTPRYDRSTYTNVEFFIPWKDIQLKAGRHQYYCAVFLESFRSANYTLAKSKLYSFYGTGPEGAVSGFTYPGPYSTYFPGPDPTKPSTKAKEDRSSSIITTAIAAVTIGALIYGASQAFSSSTSSSSSPSSSSSSSYNDLYVSSSDIQSTNSYCTLNDLRFYGWKGDNYDYSTISLRNGHDYNLYRLRNTSSSSRYFIYVYDIGGKKSPFKRYYATSGDAVEAIEKMDCRFCKWFKNKKGRNATYSEFNDWKTSNL